MSKEFFAVFPTFLGLNRTEEIKGRPLAGVPSTGDIKTDFVLKYYDLAVKIGKQFGINPVIILAQAAIESGWGTSPLARLHNNFFGITGYGANNEYWKGTKYLSKSSGIAFRVYNTVGSGFADFARLLVTKYPQAAKASESITGYAALISSSPYINEKAGDNRAKYKELIIRNAAAIITISKKKYLSLYN